MTTIRHVSVNAATGEVTEWEEERDDILSEAEAIALEQAGQAARAVEEHNAAIRAQLDANDAKIIRALVEGDAGRVEAHKAQQAALRAQLVR